MAAAAAGLGRAGEPLRAPSPSSPRGATAPSTSGAGTAPTRPLPNALYRDVRRPWPDNPLRHGHLVLDRRRAARRRHHAAGDGAPRRRPAPPGGSPGSRRPTASDSVAWFAAVARLAASTVAAGLVAPSIHDDRGMTVARWVPVDDDTVGAALDDLAAAMPPICAPTGRRRPTDIHAALVDGVARNRLADRGWRPALPLVARAGAGGRALGVPRPGVARPGAPRQRSRPPRRARRSWPPASTATSAGCAASPSSCPRSASSLPDDPLDDWEVRLELVDEVDPGRWCTADDVWDRTPLAVELAGGDEHIGALAGEVLSLARTRRRVRRRRHRAADGRRARHARARRRGRRAVPRAGTGRARRARHRPARTRAPGARRRRRPRQRHAVRQPPTTAARFGREAVVDWRLVVADDDGPAAITEAELARAERDGATLLHTGRRWVRIDPAAMRRARQRLDEHRRDHAVVDAVTLLRLAGDGEVGAPTARRRGRGPTSCSPASPTSGCSEEHEPAGFVGELRPYQRRGLGWLRFLERLGLGGCLADDMGLGKTADDARPPPRPSRAAPRRVPAVGRPQLGARGGPLHAVAARPRPPRRRAHPASSPAPTSSSPPTGCCRATSSTWRGRSGRRSSPTRRR